MNGIINVLKPPMMTSQSVVSAVKKIISEPHVGHTGTLDPNASGVLPVCTGKATKLAEYLLADEKEYVGEILFGYATDSYDTEGSIIKTCKSIPSFDDVKRILPEFTGKLLQSPPIYSAIKINGKKAYELARDNRDVEIPKREVTVRSIELLSNPEPQRFIIRVKCSKGTYIRSLANDIAEKLGSCGCLSMLVRTSCGVFNIENAHPLEEIKEAFDQGRINDILIDPNDAMAKYPFVDFTKEYEKRLLCGNQQVLGQARAKSNNLQENEEVVRILCDGEFIALGKTLLTAGGQFAVQPTKVIAQ